MNEIKDRRILMVGGAGFIGHHLALFLKKAGADVSIADSLQINNLLSFISSSGEDPLRDFYQRMTSKRLELLRQANIPIHVFDARDYHALGRLVSHVKPQVLIHLAAVAHANRSNKDPYSTFDHSLRTLENALDCSRDRLEHFIYFSSSMVYGNFSKDLVTEEDLCEPVGIYGALKYAGEKMVIAYNQVFDLPYTIVRPSALYGERCVSRRVGQVFIENAIRDLKIVVDGDGTDRLDFTYIQDLCVGIGNILENDNSLNQIFNLTYGSSRSIIEMIDILREQFPSVEIDTIERDKLMPVRGTLSIDKARRLIDYCPSYPLEVGFTNYIRWYKDSLNSHTSQLD